MYSDVAQSSSNDAHLLSVCVCECSCVCPPGFEGQRCEINPDDCEDNDCENNSTCIDGVNNYTCVCPPNYTGTHTRNPTCSICFYTIDILATPSAPKRLGGSASPSTIAYTDTHKIIFSTLLHGKFVMDSLSAVT